MMENIRVRYTACRKHVVCNRGIYAAAAKTTGIILYTCGVLASTPVLVRYTSAVSIVFTIQTLLVLGSTAACLWRYNIQPIKLTLLQACHWLVWLAVTGWRELRDLSTESGANDRDQRYWLKVHRRKTVRIFVMMWMMKYCVCPEIPVYLLLGLIWYVTSCHQLKIGRSELYKLMSYLPMISDYIPLQRVSQVKGQVATTSHRFKQFLYGTWLVTRICLSCLSLFYLASYSRLFTFYVYVYVCVTQTWLEQQLINIVLACEIDDGLLAACEGLEQYYIAGILALAEFCLTLIFMVWSLIGGYPLLMLVSLYTNIYCVRHDVFSFIITPAAYERAFLAKFERISADDLGEDEDENCPICLKWMGIARVTRCGHIFHGHCLRTMKAHGNSLCPLCRAEIM